MATANASFDTKKLSIPATRLPGKYLLVLKQDGVVKSNVQLFPVQTTYALEGLADGVYTAEIQRLDTEGQPIEGSLSVSAPLTVVNTHEVDVPNVVTLTLA